MSLTRLLGVVVSFPGLFFVSKINALLEQEDNLPLNYSQYKLIRIVPASSVHLDYLRQLYLSPFPYQLDFWQPPSHLGNLVDVSVSPGDADIFMRDLETRQFDFAIAINDLEQAIKEEHSSPSAQGPAAHRDGAHHSSRRFTLDKYHRLGDIDNYLSGLRKDYPHLVTLVELGRSHENRSITMLKLSGTRSFVDKASIYIDGGIHAREWIAPATALIIIDHLVTGYERDPVIQAMLDQIDWYIVPVLNVDGYEYTHVKNRMWRKNRRPAQCKKNFFHTVCCAGVDLNRNFNWFWSATGSSSDPCHDTFHGPEAFSEPESKAVRDFLEKNPVKAFITLHSYSQLWLIPYGHRRRSYPEDYSTALQPLAVKATKALNELYGTKYAVGTGADLLYEASGASHDWAKGVLKVPYSYLVELRPKSGNYGNGFLLPEREIRATGEETMEAIKVIADELIGQFTQPKTSITGVNETKMGGQPSKQANLSSTTIVPPPVIRCIDYGSYCPLWKIHRLCNIPRIVQLCPRSCLSQCLSSTE